MKTGIKIINTSTLILKNDIILDEGIDLDDYLVVDKDCKDLVICKSQKRIIYSLLKKGEGKAYEQIRGYIIQDSSYEQIFHFEFYFEL